MTREGSCIRRWCRGQRKGPLVDVRARALYASPVTTSILDEKEIARLIKAIDPASPPSSLPNPAAAETVETKPVSLNELIDRFRGLLTPEEADAIERTIEENCERMDD